MSKYLNCNEETCNTIWKTYKGDKDRELILKGEKPDLILTHCQIKNCHRIYHKGKNGYTCSWCEVEICDHCAEKEIKTSKYEENYCNDCYKDIKSKK